MKLLYRIVSLTDTVTAAAADLILEIPKTQVYQRPASAVSIACGELVELSNRPGAFLSPDYSPRRPQR